MPDLRPLGLIPQKEQDAIKNWPAGFEVFSGDGWKKTKTLSPEKVYRRIYSLPTISAFEDAPETCDTIIVEDDSFVKFYDSIKDKTFSEKGENEGWEPNTKIRRVREQFIFNERDEVEYIEEGINTKDIPTIEDAHKHLCDLKAGDNVIILRNFVKKDATFVPYSSSDEKYVNTLTYVTQARKDSIVLGNGQKYPFWCLEKVDFCPECGTELGKNNEHLV